MEYLDTRALRSLLVEYKQPSATRALVLFLTDIALYVLMLAGVILAENIAVRMICGLLAGTVISSLFVIGHDAAHDAFTPHRSWNRIIARIAFLPSLHNFGLWLTEHNRIHHQSTNVKGLDSWSPFSKEEYDRMPAWRQRLEQFYRSVYGMGFYYLIERWWKNKFYPYKRIIGKYNSVYADFLLVVAFLAAYMSLLVWLGNTLSHTTPLELILLGFVVPFLQWNYMMAFTVYQHHTHETIGWALGRNERERYGGQEDFTLHVCYPGWYNRMSHNIMEHPAHHVDPRIPCYRLAEAQAALEKLTGPRMRVYRFSVKAFLDTLRKCKLYDYEQHCWMDFSGNITGRVKFPVKGNCLSKAA